MKIFGALLIILGGFSLGVSLTRKLFSHISLIGDIIESLGALKGCIAFSRMRLEDAFARLSCMDKETKEFFEQCRAGLCKYPKRELNTIWRENVSLLFEEKMQREREIMLNLGESLGRADIDAQLQAISRAEREFERLLAAARDEYTTHRRMYMGISLISAASVVIILL